MIRRTIYAIKEAWHFRVALRQYRNDTALQVNNITLLTPEYLQNLRIEVFVLDFDGVLNSHGEAVPRPEVVAWLYTIPKTLRVFILSNKPTSERLEYFAKNFPNIGFITAKRKKPYPDGLQEIQKIANVPAKSILLVDDRLVTGILATLIAGTQGLWLTKPYINLKRRPFAETGFIILRFLEYWGLK